MTEINKIIAFLLLLTHSPIATLSGLLTVFGGSLTIFSLILTILIKYFDNKVNDVNNSVNKISKFESKVEELIKEFNLRGLMKENHDEVCFQLR